MRPCIGGTDPVTGRWASCPNTPRYRTPYRSTFPQAPVCAVHATRNGKIDVTPTDPYGEFHHSPIGEGMCRDSEERAICWGAYVAEDENALQTSTVDVPPTPRMYRD